MNFSMHRHCLARTGHSASLMLLLALSPLLHGGCADEGPDTTPPGQVTGISATMDDGFILVSWQASTVGDFSHYLLYQGTTSTSLTSTGENITTSKDVTDLILGTIYYFYVTAVDEAGNESAPSSTVQARATSLAYETSLGWTEFEAGEYDTSKARFQTALQFNASHAEASSGLGWSNAMLGLLSDAVTAFQAANSAGLTTQDANAGLAVAYRDLPNLNSAILYADTVIDNEPSYVFSHRTSIDYKDMHLVMAQCYYRLGESSFSDAQAQVDILDPGNGLDPGTPGTWVVDSVTYNTYAEALLMKIEELEASIGG